MKYTCPKCGKVIELSVEQLIASEYFTVCPQCLTRLQIVGDYAYVPVDDGSLDLTSTPAAPTASPADVASTPSVPAAPAPPALPQGQPPAQPGMPPLPSNMSGVGWSGGQGAPGSIDPLMGEAIAFLAQCNAITPVMLRDRFGITIERAQELLAQLEQAGVVGPSRGGAPRSILIPHKTDVGMMRMPQNDNGGNAAPGEGNNQNRTFTFNCSGCLMWFIIISVVLFMVKSCAG